jgi:serine protease SohB
MDFLSTYGLFLAKITTIVLAILILFGFITAMSAKSKNKQKGKLSINKINEKFDEMTKTIQAAIDTKADIKARKQAEKALKKQQKKKDNAADHPQRIFVIHFNGDVRASAVTALREEVTAILLTAQSDDQVVCCLESPGGMVNAYGLAASQLQRIRQANIKLIIAVDKVAASGGYMMACVADQILAAPFAIIGSIGVVAQLPNFHRLLEKNQIDFEQLTGGKYKRTLTMLGKNTKQGREKMQEEIDETHELFKSFITNNRPTVDIESIATGEHWYGTQALDLKLIDRIQTSDDYILAAKDDYAIYAVKFNTKKSLGKRLSDSAQLLTSKITNAAY